MHNDESARHILKTALREALREHPGAPRSRLLRSKLAEQLVTEWARPGHHMNTVMTAFADQIGAALRGAAKIFASDQPGMYELRRRAALLRAREQHRHEGTPHWITGRFSPSGCTFCGMDAHHHPDEDTDGYSGLIPPHPFEPVVATDQDPADRAHAMTTIRIRMRQRRHQRAGWLRQRGFSPCAVCWVPHDIHPAEHEVYVGDDPIPFGAPPEDFERGPWQSPGDDQVIAYATDQISHRWDHLYPETWVDEGAEAEMHAIRAEALNDFLADHGEW